MTRPIQLPVTFDAANRKKDRSLSLRCTTNLEVTNADFAEVDKLVGSSGWFLFSANEFSDAEVPVDDAPGDTKKPSQRLRAVLFLSWQQNTDQSEDFDAYYKRRMNKLVEAVKGELHD